MDLQMIVTEPMRDWFLKFQRFLFYGATRGLNVARGTMRIGVLNRISELMKEV